MQNVGDLEHMAGNLFVNLLLTDKTCNQSFHKKLFAGDEIVLQHFAGQGHPTEVEGHHHLQ